MSKSEELPFEALGNRVIILPDAGTNEDGEKVTEWGFVEQTAKQVDDYRDQTTTGVVVDYGPAAWIDPIMGGEPWVKVGERVVYAKYSGKDFTVDGIDYVCVNDDAIQVRLKEIKDD
jgi:co-chaperonin GroES (HSP10)